ncbi:N-acetylneuraminate synthase family protein [Synechococcus sp. CC9311]|uniref:N-acetylneuraminate synthase family protein n=1 Tax=Synechococcus sp. (strain CC9311) TaxID=64471 RepID=UPI0000DDA9C7|nr:N-acetylneuraminate synthase family protein [Synechococcus sp. CC9311]ABI47387.1 NeuB family protein [Synechococcus sp. CC9311]
MSLRDICIGTQVLGEGHLPIILPDIDMFFNGDLEIARGLIESVSKSGLRTIKTAILEDPMVVFDTPAEERYLCRDGSYKSVNYRSLIQKKVMTLDQHRELFNLIKSYGLNFIVSVYTLESVDFAVSEGAIAIKIASSNINFLPLIEKSARTGLPLLIDTGKSTLCEIFEARHAAYSANQDVKLIFEHSPAAPPAPIERQDLSFMNYLSNLLGEHAGLSHHSDDLLMIIASVAIGAKVIEFGLCRDNEADDQDVFHAVKEGQLMQLVENINRVNIALGDPYSRIDNEVMPNNGRMSLRAKQGLIAGTRMNLENVSFSFPPIGIPANEWARVQGKILKRNVQAGMPICNNDVEYE